MSQGVSVLTLKTSFRWYIIEDSDEYEGASVLVKGTVYR